MYLHSMHEAQLCSQRMSVSEVVYCMYLCGYPMQLMHKRGPCASVKGCVMYILSWFVRK